MFQILIFFLYIPAFAADAAAVHPSGIKTLSANGLTTFFINGNPSFNNGPSNLLKNSPDWIILTICVLKSFKAADVLLLKAFLSFTFLSCCD